MLHLRNMSILHALLLSRSYALFCGSVHVYARDLCVTNYTHSQRHSDRETSKEPATHTVTEYVR